MGKYYCYVASARRRTRRLGAHGGGEGQGHIVSPRAQLFSDLLHSCNDTVRSLSGNGAENAGLKMTVAQNFAHTEVFVVLYFPVLYFLRPILPLFSYR